MSNILTDFVRVYAQEGHRIDEVEAQWITWMLLGPRGSYWVPVRVGCGPDGGYAEIQYGSGKSTGIVDFCRDHIGYWRYGAIWGRHFNEGSTQDVIWQDDPDDGPSRFCRYGFDDVRVTTADGRPPAVAEATWLREDDGSWRLTVAGGYRAGNDRSAQVGPCATPATDPPDPGPDLLPLSTPTTPSVDGDEPQGIDPPWLAGLTGDGSNATSVEYRWRGRVVHRAVFGIVESYYETAPSWHHRCADHWDNCLDPGFLRFTGATGLLASEETYERDRVGRQALRRPTVTGSRKGQIRES